MDPDKPKTPDKKELQEQIAALSKELEALQRQKVVLGAGENLYNYLYDNLNDAVFIIGLDGTFLDVNQVAIDRLGYSRQQLLTMRPQSVNDASYAAGVAERMAEVVRQGSLFFETVHVASDGRRIPTEVSSRMIRFMGKDAILALARDISDRKKAKAALLESEKKYRDLFEHASDAIFILDKDFHYQDVNRRAVELFGYSREEFLAMSVFDVIPADQVPRSTAEFQKLARRGSYEHFVGRMRTKDGRWLDIEVSSTSIIENGEYAGSRDIVRDISDRVRAEKELREAKEQAEEASIAKSQFVANISHEIRTPLSGLLGMLSLLRQSGLNPDQQQYVHLASISGERLLQVVNDILDFAKIEASKLVIEERCFELSPVIDETLAILSHKAAAKGLRLLKSQGQGMPEVVRGDPGRLSQIILNLADNAIKFTDDGGVVIHFEVREKNDRTVLLLFQVRDTGIGVPKEKQQDVFSAFTQADGSHSRRYGGTGLGLAISSQLAALMGGEMWLESPPVTAMTLAGENPAQWQGRGSIFSFTVRCGLEAFSEEVGESGSASGLDRSEGTVAGRILLAEDDPVNRLLTATVLENLGLTVIPAENGRQVLEKMNDGRFDLVLMDVQMPEMDGMAATAAIRAAEAKTGGHIPIIALTAHAMQDDREKCLAAGMDDYLAKPVVAAEMKLLIRRYLGKGRKNHAG